MNLAQAHLLLPVRVVGVGFEVGIGIGFGVGVVRGRGGAGPGNSCVIRSFWVRLFV